MITTDRLNSAITAVEQRVNAHKIMVTVPRGAIIDVIGESSLQRMLDVRWGERVLSLFRLDLDERAHKLDNPQRRARADST